MLTPEQLAGCRAAQLATLTDQVAVISLATGYDRFGTPTTTETVVATLPCRIGEPRGALRELADRLLNDGVARQAARVITLPHGTALDPQQLLRQGPRRWRIVHIATDHSFATAVRVLVTSTAITPQ